MSTILAVRTTRRVHVLSDSAVFSGDHIVVSKGIKCVQVHGNIFATAGNLAATQVGQRLFRKLRSSYWTGADSVHDFVQNWRECMQKTDMLDRDPNSHGEALIAYGRKMWIIDTDGCYMEPDENVSAIGDAAFGLGALTALIDRRESPQRALEKAMSVQHRHSASCRPPYVYLAT